MIADEYEASITDALAWARTAEVGEYLVRYKDAGSTPKSDPGSRCGYSDVELDEIEQVLRARDLRLVTDDRGLLAAAAERW